MDLTTNVFKDACGSFEWTLATSSLSASDDKHQTVKATVYARMVKSLRSSDVSEFSASLLTNI